MYKRIEEMEIQGQRPFGLKEFGGATSDQRGGIKKLDATTDRRSLPSIPDHLRIEESTRAPDTMAGLRRTVATVLELHCSAHAACCSRTAGRSSLPGVRHRLYSSTATSTPGAGPSRPLPGPGAKPRRRPYYLLALPLALLPFTLFGSSRAPLDPYTYSDHELGTSTRITAQHAQITIPLGEQDAALFRTGEVPDGDGMVTIQHVMIKNPDLQIERPYTPINDVGKDGQIELVIKRVKGGEVGRRVCSPRPMMLRY